MYVSIAVVLLLLLISILSIKTLMFSSKQVTAEPGEEVVFDREMAVKRLSKAIQFKTISYQNRDGIDYKEFLNMQQFLQEAFPKVHEKLQKEVIEQYSLLYKWQGSDENLDPILLLAHTDVVPVQESEEKLWNFPPFGGHVDEEYIWGRGTLDDKSSVMGILEAVEALLEKEFCPKATIYLAFGHDEEIGGAEGAAKMAELLESRNVKLAYVLDEGLAITDGIMPGISVPVAMVGIAEKGYVSLELLAEGEEGHSSMPPRISAPGILSKAILKLEKQQLPGAVQGAILKLFQFAAPEMSFLYKFIFANLWLFAPLLKKLLEASPSTNALLRTTTAVTMLEGSPKENVLARKARAVVNFRILPGDSIASVMNHVKKVIKDPRVKISILGDIHFEPSMISSDGSQSFKMLCKTIRQVFPEVIVAPSLTLAGTDSRHYERLSQNVYRFGPIWLKKEDMNQIHGTNERLSIRQYERMVIFYAQLLLHTSIHHR